MTIRNRFRLGTLFSIVVALLIGAILVVNSQHVRQATLTNRMAHDIVTKVFALNIVTNEYLLYRNERTQVQWQRTYDALSRLLAADVFTSPYTRVLVSRMRQDQERMHTLFADWLANVDSPAGYGEQTTLGWEGRLIGPSLATTRAMVVRALQLAERSQAPTAASGFDEALALQRMGGNRELLRELAGVLCAECPNVLEDMRQAISKNDALRLRRAAHTLKGEVGNFGAAAVFDAALQLDWGSL